MRLRYRYALAGAAALAAAVLAAVEGGPLRGPAPATAKLITAGGSAAWLILGASTVLAASSFARDALWERVGSALAGVVRLAGLLAGLAIVLVVTLALLRVPVGQLVLGGTFASVVVGIAAQQSLGNLFAGIQLMLTRPFAVGGHVRIREGGLEHEGTVLEVGLTHVKLHTAGDGPLLLPNTTVLAAAIDHAGAPAPGRRRSRRIHPGGASDRGSRQAPQHPGTAAGGDHG